MNPLKKHPRLYCDQPLGQGCIINLAKDQTHYLKNVMRLGVESQIRVFNGKDGEWLCQISEMTKKSAALKTIEQISAQPVLQGRRVLIFAPVKKTETDLIVQKATELGVTDICPVVMDHSNTHKIRKDRFETIAVEAAEQSERLTLPVIHDLMSLDKCLKELDQDISVCIAMERLGTDAPPLTINSSWAVIIGPEGGFSDQEKEKLMNIPDISTLSLGKTVLRAETAAISALAVLNHTQDSLT